VGSAFSTFGVDEKKLNGRWSAAKKALELFGFSSPDCSAAAAVWDGLAGDGGSGVDP
jgi:hypothetical protein